MTVIFSCYLSNIDMMYITYASNIEINKERQIKW